MLIPYTTKEDHYHYYETRNYVNDVNRKHTQVLQTYDDYLNKRESYSYGYGRSRYINETSGDSYNYLTNRSGSVTGLTQNGQSVASSSYGLYGSIQQTTDTTGNPFAYNGEARDVTGLDYLRARYYDSRAGSFLTGDSYLGNQTDPLSQNLYAYVQNNPVNYTDPSGHKKNWFQRAWDHTKQVARNVYNAGARFVKDPIGTIKNVSRNILNVAGNIGRAIGNIGRTALNIGRSVGSWVTQQISRSLSSQSSYINSSSYVAHQRSQAQAQVIAQLRYQQQVTREFTQATGIKGTPKTREAQNLFKNWSNDLKDMYKHVCTTAERWKDAGVNFAKNIDWKNVLKTSAYIAGEFFSVNDIYRVVTGTDPLTGEKASRLEAAA
ncbi:pre-toxin TG domain-containing protein [Streptococcus suis]|nr:pre-toxin TG domain-containing protein [Streptococcus suis]